MAKSTPKAEGYDPFEAGDFEAILELTADTVTPPGLVAAGPWSLRLIGTFMETHDQEEREANPKLNLMDVTLTYTPYEPGDTVDSEKVESGDWRGRKIRVRRRINDRGEYVNFMNHMELHGVSTAGRKIKEVLDAAKGRLIKGKISSYTYTRKDSGESVTENQVKDFSRVDA